MLEIFYNPYVVGILFGVALVFGLAAGVLYTKYKKKGEKAP